MSDGWGIAISDGKGSIMYYTSNLPTEGGSTDGTHNMQGPMFDKAEDSDAFMLAWAKATSSGREVAIHAVALRNNRKFLCRFIPIPEGGQMVTFSQWGTDASWPLSEKEESVCRKLVSGLSIELIAEELRVTRQAIQKLRRSAMDKLGCETFEQLGAVTARQSGP